MPRDLAGHTCVDHTLSCEHSSTVFHGLLEKAPVGVVGSRGPGEHRSKAPARAIVVDTDGAAPFCARTGVRGCLHIVLPESKPKLDEPIGISEL